MEAQEKRHTDGVSFQQILCCFPVRIHWFDQRNVLSLICALPVLGDPLTMQSHLVNPIIFAYCEARAPGSWCVYSLQGGWSAVCYRTIPGMIRIYFKRGDLPLWPARLSLSEKMYCGASGPGAPACWPFFFPSWQQGEISSITQGRAGKGPGGLRTPSG